MAHWLRCDLRGPTILPCCIAFSTIPTVDENANLHMIGDLAARYPECVIGYSDHTTPKPGLPSLLTAWLLGAVILEKHFTHDTSLPGNDHYHAMTVDDLRSFRTEVSRVVPLLGSRRKAPIASEEICPNECETQHRGSARSFLGTQNWRVGHHLQAPWNGNQPPVMG